MKPSVHVFNPGDRVIFSITEKATSKSGREYNRHRKGRAVVKERLAADGNMPTYMIQTNRGFLRIAFAKELSLVKQ